jgi:hypothetical protein
MPFHAFLSVWLGHLFGHQAAWQSWKELLLGMMVGLAVVAGRRQPTLRQRLRHPAVYLAAAFTGISLIVTAISRPPFTTALYGLKTDVEFLVAFGLALMVADRALVTTLRRIVVVASGVVIGFGLLQIYVLPANWLVHFGYGPATIQPYLLVDPAVRSIRILSTLGGPNQLGSFLILPLCLVAWALLRRPRLWQAIYLLAGMVVVWHTFSRSAVIGLAVAFLIIALMRVTRHWRLPLALAATILLAIVTSLLTTDAGTYQNLQYYLFHQTARSTGIAASTTEHSQAYQQGLRVAAAHLLGTGLGTAGPASLHSSHPFIPEDYYLQLSIETGVAGLLAFTAFEVVVGIELWRRGTTEPAAGAAVAALAGIAVINLVLHGWADSSTALVFWSLTGAALGTTA